MGSCLSTTSELACMRGWLCAGRRACVRAAACMLLPNWVRDSAAPVWRCSCPCAFGHALCTRTCVRVHGCTQARTSVLRALARPAVRHLHHVWPAMACTCKGAPTRHTQRKWWERSTMPSVTWNGSNGRRAGPRGWQTSTCPGTTRIRGRRGRARVATAAAATEKAMEGGSAARATTSRGSRGSSSKYPFSRVSRLELNPLSSPASFVRLPSALKIGNAHRACAGVQDKMICIRSDVDEPHRVTPGACRPPDDRAMCQSSGLWLCYGLPLTLPLPNLCLQCYQTGAVLA